MARKRARRKRSTAVVASPVAAQTVAPIHAQREPASAEPVFWFGFEVAWAKLVVARFAIFALLAVDAFLVVRHAPRYGAGDFNVGHLGFLGELAPGRVGYGAGQLALAYLFAMVACGVATRVLVPIGAALYGWLYFTSQLDSYQHHYLVAILLVIASFVPWQRPAGIAPAGTVRAWAVRLLLVQLAIMYLWAAVSKLDLAWLDGRTLGAQVTGRLAALITNTIGMSAASILVVAIELSLAATVWSRRAAVVAAPIGLVFHAGILVSGLEIGLFAYLMLGIYVLVIPDRFWVALLRGGWRKLDALAAPSWVAWGIAIAGAIAVAKLVRLEHAFVLGIATSAVPLTIAVHALMRGRAPAAIASIAHVLAIVLWLVLDRSTDVAVDYYRFWGGSQRRLGHLDTAERAYRQLLKVAPAEAVGHYQLGRLLLQQGRPEGLAALREAQRLEPARARAFVAEARYLAERGQRAEAITKAKQATLAEPGHQDARALLDSLTSAGAAVPAGGEPD